MMFSHMRRMAALAALALLLMVPLILRAADEDAVAEKDKTAEQLKLAAAAAPALVQVEYTLQYDKGEAPRGGGGGDYRGWETYIRDERPLQQPGLLVAPNKVITPDPLMHPRFIKSIAIRTGKDAIPAHPDSFLRGIDAMVLVLDKPLPGGKPLVFDAKAKGPYYAVTYGRPGTEWETVVRGIGGATITTDHDRKLMRVPTWTLLTDAAGTAVGINVSGEMPLDESWKGSPLDRPAISAADHDKLLDKTAAAARDGIVRVTLNFRSPKDQEASLYSRDETNMAVAHVLGVLVDEKTVLVLAELKPALTARLERIRVYQDTGSEKPEPTDAKFKATLTDYGAFVITLDKPLHGALAISPQKDIEKYEHVLLPAADILLQGEKRLAYYRHERLMGAHIGWRGMVYPELSSDNIGTFAFDPDGALLVLPVSRREKTSVRERYSSEHGPVSTCATQIKEALADLAKNSDASNVPLSEDEENRIAWMGVELQPLNADLARVNNVADQTNDGEFGALVIYVYPDSPAAKAGIEAGYILMRLNAEGQPKPIDIHVDPDPRIERAFPWDRLATVPEQYFEQIPTPWPSSENNFTRMLTDLGFGTKYTAEFFHDGKSVKKDFEVVMSPPHWTSAPKAKAASIGVTVREMTYEVQRYFQKKPDNAGVVISKIEMGSKGSLSGLKPYEIITHVNDVPVNTVKEFEKATAGQTELRLSVKRKEVGRIVKITIGPAATAPAASQPADAAATPR